MISKTPYNKTQFLLGKKNFFRSLAYKLLRSNVFTVHYSYIRRNIECFFSRTSTQHKINIKYKQSCFCMQKSEANDNMKALY